MTMPNLPSRSASTPLPSYTVAPYKPPEESPKATIYRELAKAADGPGEMFNMMSGKHMEDVRDQYETSAPAKGVIYEMKETSDGQRASVKGFTLTGGRALVRTPADYRPGRTYRLRYEGGSGATRVVAGEHGRLRTVVRPAGDGPVRVRIRAAA